MLLLERLTGIGLTGDVFADPQEATRRRSEVLSVLAERARTVALTADAEEQRLLFALIRTGTPQDRPDLTDDEWTLLAHLLLAERKRVSGTATSYRAFSFALSTRAHLDRLLDEVNATAEVFGLTELTLTRHGIRDVGVLRVNAAVYLDLIGTVQRDFAELDLPVMLAYGTLLGAIREGDFLAHDDDGDLMFPVEADSVRTAAPPIDQLCRTLTERGWDIWRNESPNTLNFHLTDPATRRHVDLFPMLIHDEQATVHMERMRLRAIPRGLVLPARPITFLGAELLAPADPEGFLAARYGDTWSVADPYDDWSWPLR